VSISSQPLGVRVCTRQLLDEEIAKVTKDNKKAATQIKMALCTKTVLSDDQRAFRNLMTSTDVSLFHRFIYYIRSHLSSSYRKQAEATAESYYKFLQDDVRKDLSTISNPLVDLCDELFELNAGCTFPKELFNSYEGPILVHNSYELMEKCIAPYSASANA
jgi:hypothetical protein